MEAGDGDPGQEGFPIEGSKRETVVLVPVGIAKVSPAYQEMAVLGGYIQNVQSGGFDG